MKYILIIGTTNAGKSTTVDAVCKSLQPNSVQRLNAQKTFEHVDTNVEILNGTYLIKVNGKTVLVVAGAPTEQNIRITVLIEICIKLKIEIDYALVSMRTVERREGFDTKSELKNFGDCIWEKRIWPIDGKNFRENKEWKSRIEEISGFIQAA